MVADDNPSPPIPKTLNEAVEMTLCAKEEGRGYRNVKCIERMCEDCGVDKFPLLPEESSDNGLVKWSCYEYVPTGKYVPDGTEKTPPSQLFKYITDVLAGYPSHIFKARWQRDQLESLVNNLLQGHVV